MAHLILLSILEKAVLLNLKSMQHIQILETNKSKNWKKGGKPDINTMLYKYYVMVSIMCQHKI